MAGINNGYGFGSAAASVLSTPTTKGCMSSVSLVNVDDFNKVEIILMDIVYYKEIKGSAIDSNHY